MSQVNKQNYAEGASQAQRANPVRLKIKDCMSFCCLSTLLNKSGDLEDKSDTERFRAESISGTRRPWRGGAVDNDSDAKVVRNLMKVHELYMVIFKGLAERLGPLMLLFWLIFDTKVTRLLGTVGPENSIPSSQKHFPSWLSGHGPVRLCISAFHSI